jgi:low affinity Fe/Cu permease
MPQKNNSANQHRSHNSARTNENSVREYFRRGAEWTATAVGSHWAFVVATGVVLVWAITGPVFGFSDTWQLVINTGTTIVTFLVVFLIQNAQNRSAKLIDLKLDELLRGVEGARTSFVDLDHLTDDELEDVRNEFHRLRGKYARLVDDDIRHVDAALRGRQKRH